MVTVIILSGFWVILFFFFFNFESPSSAFLLLFMGFFFFFLQRNPMVKTHLPCVSNRLTLHAQPIRAVLGLQDKAIAVLASILGGWCRALPPAPVSALGPAGRPLAPRGPPAIHCHKKKKKKKQQQVKERRSFLKAERGQGSSRNKTPNTEENAPPRSAAFILTATSSTCSPYFLWILQTFLTRGLWLFLHWPCTGTLMGHTEIKVVTRSYIKVNPSSVPFSILGFGLKIRGPPYGSNIPWIVHVISASKLLWG